MKKCVSISLDGPAKDSSGTTKVKSATVKDSSGAKCVKSKTAKDSNSAKCESCEESATTKDMW